MGTTKKIIDDYNEKLFEKLFPKGDEPIFCNSITNPNDPIYQKSFAEIAKEKLNEILEEQEFLTDFEQIKHNLKID